MKLVKEDAPGVSRSKDKDKDEDKDKEKDKHKDKDNILKTKEPTSDFERQSRLSSRDEKLKLIFDIIHFLLLSILVGGIMTKCFWQMFTYTPTTTSENKINEINFISLSSIPSVEESLGVPNFLSQESVFNVEDSHNPVEDNHNHVEDNQNPVAKDILKPNIFGHSDEMLVGEFEWQ